jgi:hypothetical protein
MKLIDILVKVARFIVKGREAGMWDKGRGPNSSGSPEPRNPGRKL